MDKLICLGKNYAAHANEMNETLPEKPVIFLKPPSIRRQVGRNGERCKVVFPNRGSELHPEVEIAIWVSKGGMNLSEAEAGERIGWLTVGLDLTLRDLQLQLKKQGHPWTLSKVFPDSTILGPWLSIDEFPNFMDTEFRLRQGDTIRQSALPSEMLLKPASAIAYVSRFFPISPGDVIFTGTPAGVAPVQIHDCVSVEWGKIHYEVEWTGS